MRVIHIFSALYQGGAENQLELLLDASKKNTPDVEHIVISLKSEKTPLWHRLEKQGHTVLTCNLNSPLNVRGFVALRNLIKQYNQPHDVFQCWMYHANLFTTLAALGLNINLFWNVRRTSIPSGLTGVISKLSAWISKVVHPYIVSNSYAGLHSHEAAGYNFAKSAVISNGFVSPQSYSTASLKDRDYLAGLNEGDIVFGVVGRYSPIKGHYDLFKAIKLLKLKLNDVDFKKLKFVFIGRDVQSAEALQEFIHDPIFKSNFIFLGEKENVFPYFCSFNFFVMPSRSEGFPNCLVEAMLHAIPCIATDVGDVAIIAEGAVKLAQPSNPTSLCEHLYEAVHMTQTSRDELASKLQNIALSQYSIEESWSKYFKLYKRTMEEI